MTDEGFKIEYSKHAAFYGHIRAPSILPSPSALSGFGLVRGRRRAHIARFPHTCTRDGNDPSNRFSEHDGAPLLFCLDTNAVVIVDMSIFETARSATRVFVTTRTYDRCGIRTGDVTNLERGIGFSVSRHSPGHRR